MVKYCPNCGAELKDEFVYCGKCGCKFNKNINNSYLKKDFQNKTSLMYNFKLKILVIIGLIFSIAHLINNFYLLKIFTDNIIENKIELENTVISNMVDNAGWDTSVVQLRIDIFQGFQITFLIITVLFIMVVILASISLVYIHNKDLKAKKTLILAGVLSSVSLISILFKLISSKNIDLSGQMVRDVYLFVNSYSNIYIICIIISIIFYFAAVLLYNRFNNQEFSINFKKNFNKFKSKFLKRFDFIKRNKDTIRKGSIVIICIITIITAYSIMDVSIIGKNVIKIHADDNINGTLIIQEFSNLSKTENGEYDLKSGQPVLEQKNIEIKNGEGSYEIPDNVELFAIDDEINIFDKEYPENNTEKKITIELWNDGIKVGSSTDNMWRHYCSVGIDGLYDKNCTRICDTFNHVYIEFINTFFEYKDLLCNFDPNKYK